MVRAANTSPWQDVVKRVMEPNILYHEHYNLAAAQMQISVPTVPEPMSTPGLLGFGARGAVHIPDRCEAV
jgi:hypothetical protein